ncbi:hypothetical protein B0T18DRAFT_423555 [Schizothecium vesticola]|uniref:Uncharacterized protein n=1 Tax=Schizothecium vesticola TaxID=314040 RepID=A0AA40KBQ1_9PEZI|nr:hypothetical protein B0T18DRAFT_423555 [Schizothecium vesticola]
MTTQPPTIHTYFLAPGWSIQAPSIRLGSVITHPTQPHVSIFTPDLPTTTVTTTTSPPFTGKPHLHPTGITGLFGTFLDLHGLGDEESPTLQYDRHAVLSYSLRGATTSRFTPTAELKAKALAPGGRVAQYLEAGAAQGARVFMVTGVKTVSGASVTTGSGKGGGWRVGLSVGVEGEEGGEGVVFAFELEELGGGEVLGEGEGLEGRLDGVFGEGVFTVLEGVDEAEEGEACRIVASSRSCVDLETASSARIGREASRVRGRE